MIGKRGLSRVGRVVSSAIAAASMVLGLAVAAPNATADEGDPRGWLRPDATGTCEWDPDMYWIQNCDVYSAAMGRNILVHIIPAAHGGNGGYYLLDGLKAQEDRSGWLRDYGIGPVVENTNVTWIMPAGGNGSFYADWENPATVGGSMSSARPGEVYMWETFLTEELPVYVEQNFGVSRTNNAIGGISMGATGALRIASHRPDLYRYALSFSGYLTTSVPGSALVMQATLSSGGGFSINDMYGSAVSPKRFTEDPILLVNKLVGNTKVYLGNGTGNLGHAPANAYETNLQLVGGPLEFASLQTSNAYYNAARNAGVDIRHEVAPNGVHDWSQFGLDFTQSMPDVLATLGA